MSVRGTVVPSFAESREFGVLQSKTTWKRRLNDAQKSNRAARGGDPISPLRPDEHSASHPAQEAPIEARQGFLGRPVLKVLQHSPGSWSRSWSTDRRLADAPGLRAGLLMPRPGPIQITEARRPFRRAGPSLGSRTHPEIRAANDLVPIAMRDERAPIQSALPSDLRPRRHSRDDVMPLDRAVISACDNRVVYWDN